MTDDIVKEFEADMASVQVSKVSGEKDDERVMKLIAHMFLRVWTRIAIEAGQKLTMMPFQYSLGNYQGQMNWSVNEALNFAELPQIEMGTQYVRRHALVAEKYKVKDESRIRLVFAIEEEEVKGKPVAVNYLLYDSTLKAFKFESASDALKAAMPKWFETILTKTDTPLWEYCKDNLECVGV